MVSEDIIVKYLAGEAEQHEIIMLDNWRKASEANEKQFNEIAQLWQHSTELNQQPKLNINTAWDKVNTKIQGKSEVKVISFFKPWMAVAASILLFVGIAFWLYQPKVDTAQWMTAVAGEAQKVEINLKDGSTITLMKGQINYPESFDKNKRRVTMKSGRAFFAIARDTLRQFEIQCGQTLVTVLGTQFEIYHEGKKTTVSVSEGKVKFNTPDGEKILTKGMKASYDESSKTISTLEGDNDNSFAYATGILKYDNEILSNIIGDLARYSDRAKIEVDPSIMDCRISGKFNLNEGMKQILEAIAFTVNSKLSVSEDGLKYRLEGGVCQP